MKLSLLSLTIVLVFFFSCKKEHTKITTVNKNSTLYKVGFKAGFTQTTGSAFSAGKHLSSLASGAIDTNLVNIMIFAVYDSVGNVVQVINQVAADTLFGSANFNLRSGKYTAIIACTGPSEYSYGDLNLESGSNYSVPANLNRDFLNFDDDYRNGSFDNTLSPNTFYKKINFTVANSNINQSVSLDRIVSRVTVVIQGGLPANTPLYNYKATATIISGVASTFYVGSSSGLSDTPQESFPLQPVTSSSAYGTGNYVLSGIIVGSSITIDIIGFHEGLGTADPDIILAERKITVTCTPNTETIVTGDLFGLKATTNSSNIIIDTAWKPETITRTF